VHRSTAPQYRTERGTGVNLLLSDIEPYFEPCLNPHISQQMLFEYTGLFGLGLALIREAYKSDCTCGAFLLFQIRLLSCFHKAKVDRYLFGLYIDNACPL
jgi:hypothetical protein